jgi:hypothetical protein
MRTLNVPGSERSAGRCPENAGSLIKVCVSHSLLVHVPWGVVGNFAFAVVRMMGAKQNFVLLAACCRKI